MSNEMIPFDESTKGKKNQNSDQQDDINSFSFFTTPLSARGWPNWLIYVMSLVGLVYILNPTAGLLELLPDNLPIIGNIDEGIAFMMLWAGLVEFFEGRKNQGSGNTEE